MQTEICLSTVEAEYVALSQAMRDVLPFLDLTEEMVTIYGNYIVTMVTNGNYCSYMATMVTNGN